MTKFSLVHEAIAKISVDTIDEVNEKWTDTQMVVGVNQDGTPKYIDATKTPWGVYPKDIARSLVSGFVRTRQLAYLKRNGRSKYLPHQGTKECARRLTKIKS